MKDRDPTAAGPAARGGGAWWALAESGAGLEWVLLRRRGDRVEWGVEGARAAGTDGGPEPPPPPKGARTALVLPATGALIRVFRLPATDPAELRGMAELQADKISPFPAEHLVLSCEALSAREGHTLLLVAALRRDTVLAAAERADPAGRRAPHHVDLDLLVWWRAVRARTQGGAGRTLHVRAAANGCGLVAEENGDALLVRGLAPDALLEPAREDLCAEIALALASLEQEWGPGTCALTVWDAPDDQASKLVDDLAAATGAPVTTATTPDSFRLARAAAERAAEAGPDALNLTLPEWARDRARRRAQRRALAVAAVVLLAWTGALGAFLAGIHAREQSIGRLKTMVREAEGPAEAVRQIQTRLATLEAHTDTRLSTIEILREVSGRLPPGARLTSFSYRKGRSLQLRAEAPAPDLAYDYVSALDATRLFTLVRPEGVIQRNTPAGPVTEFRVVGEFGEESP
jgi:Tfp pilus assembly protein PilN